MSEPALPLPVYLLAGGRSRRMGGDKRALRLGGRTLLDRALDLAGGALAAVVVRRESPPEGLPAGTRCLYDAEGSEAAPIHGLAVALDDARRAGLPVRHVLLLAVDLPLLRRATLGAVAAAAVAAPPGTRVVLPEADGRLQPLAAAWSPAMLPELLGAVERGAPSLVRLATAGAHLVLPAERLGAFSEEFWNVNHPADADRVEAFLKEMR